ncbi:MULTISPECIES: transglycosylase SLT domain-containing protein [unclassified Staphylococcus]|uniref:transglycosylase SLT domain-containing protein n=1 Tax=unclassified Staphylococcus TaxID=91994 RepID=UPI0021CF76EC|nr:MULTISPECIES: transglycosylase SLT domain-containing protein [unclassified Staphylococcus]UXR78175.1 transglycosylase SLT domain-containing protein [Staphylococcus sp. IVB6227]UXR82338.1 transglycosylase SLT domain-containing protein [Staphylococcus sp. IVB6214]
MKKTLLASSLALAIGATGVATHTTDANAAEEQINKAELAQLALNNDASLNESAIHAGAYDYKFSLDGVNYHFWSDGVYFGYEYNENGSVEAASSMAQPTEIADVNNVAMTQSESNNASYVQTQQQSYSNQPAAQAAPSYNYNTAQTSSVRLSNGNTAGSVGSRAAQEMASRTGVAASTWEAIIARESNGQLNAYNPSGASGLFQTMPGWGATNTYDQQIAAATKAYNAQGLSAWGF